MSDFKNKTITNKGLELLSKAMAGDKIEFTKMQMGSGVFNGDLASQVALVEMKNTLNLTNIIRQGSQVEISATLLPKDITTEYDWSEIGLFARGNDGVEILYMYGYTQNTSFISKTSLNEKLINISVLVSNAANVTANIDNSLVYLTKEELDNHNTDPTAHDDIRQLINNINITWDNLQNKPATFPPDAHTHTKDQITDFAHTHLKADITDFAHTHTVANIVDFPASLPANGGNADTVDGKHSNEFVQMPRVRLTVGDLNNANYPDSYRSSLQDGTQIGLPVAAWYHIDYFRHVDNNGYGTQVAYPLNHNGDAYWRTSAGTVWNAWKRMSDGGNAATVEGYNVAQLRSLIGDVVGKTLTVQKIVFSAQTTQTYTYNNAKGGFARVDFNPNSTFTIIVDGQTIVSSQTLFDFVIPTSTTRGEISIPFDSAFTITHNDATSAGLIMHIYTNK